MNAQGVEVAERFLPYDRVGIYIPGGKAPLVSTSIMTGGFAQAAGVPGNRGRHAVPGRTDG